MALVACRDSILDIVLMRALEYHDGVGRTHSSVGYVSGLLAKGYRFCVQVLGRSYSLLAKQSHLPCIQVVICLQIMNLKNFPQGFSEWGHGTP